jgi:hypothetical protein
MGRDAGASAVTVAGTGESSLPLVGAVSGFNGSLMS